MSLVINKNPQIQIYSSVKGEGLESGQLATFIRLQGCNVHCFFCDEKDTWVTRNNNSEILDSSEIINKIKIFNNQNIVITGGEPSEQNLEDLITELIKQNYQVALETAATGDFSEVLLEKFQRQLFITFSPKEIYSISKIKNPRIWQYCNEVKFVFAKPEAKNYLFEVILPKLDQAGNPCPVFLMPDWFNFEASKSMILEVLDKQPKRLRMGIQAHKYWGLD